MIRNQIFQKTQTNYQNKKEVKDERSIKIMNHELLFSPPFSPPFYSIFCVSFPSLSKMYCFFLTSFPSSIVSKTSVFPSSFKVSYLFTERTCPSFLYFFSHTNLVCLPLIFSTWEDSEYSSPQVPFLSPYFQALVPSYFCFCPASLLTPKICWTCLSKSSKKLLIPRSENLDSFLAWIASQQALPSQANLASASGDVLFFGWYLIASFLQASLIWSSVAFLSTSKTLQGSCFSQTFSGKYFLKKSFSVSVMPFSLKKFSKISLGSLGWFLGSSTSLSIGLRALTWILGGLKNPLGKKKGSLKSKKCRRNRLLMVDVIIFQL